MSELPYGPSSAPTGHRTDSTAEFVLAEIRDFLAQMLGEDTSAIGPDTRFIEDLHADSLDLVELAEFVENRWEIIIADSRMSEVSTVGDACWLISQAVSSPTVGTS